jgi:adenosine deaminase CECR1
LIRIIALTISLFFSLVMAHSAFANDEMNRWFEELKASGSKIDLYKTLYAMPKGGDLHAHNTGSIFSEWMFELALEQEANGYIYYTKTKINNCRPYGGNESFEPYLMYFKTIQGSNWQALDACEQAEYKLLTDLTDEEKAAWQNSFRLDKPYEGREEFFRMHWQRMGDLVANPYLVAESMVRNVKAFSAEGLLYMEPDYSVSGYLNADGSRTPVETAIKIVRDRLAQKDVQDTGMTVRFQMAILRFLPSSLDQLKQAYQFVAQNSDLWVGLDMVGREDDDKGHPARFLKTMRELRRQYHGVNLSLHGGEVDEPNSHVRDTLTLGARRIGHGVNLITDPDLMLIMRDGPALVEINLISNLLLEYVDDFSQHPFPEYLRTGIPVALSTDDRGMWDSTMTDEFFVATTEFNLSWAEIKQLNLNSLEHAFVDEETKQKLLTHYRKRVIRFERRMTGKGVDSLGTVEPEFRSFICKEYELCALN